MTIEIMLDLETLSTQSNAAIVQLSAVSFDRAHIFNERIARSSYNHLLGRFAISVDTLNWWEQQPSQVRNYVMGGVLHPATVLEMFSKWIKALPEEPIVWANPVIFDMPILEHAYSAFDLPYPLNARNYRCFRTMSEEFASIIPRDRSKVTHNAFEDCLEQITHLQTIREFMTPPIPVSKCIKCGNLTDFSVWAYGYVCMTCFYSEKKPS